MKRVLVALIVLCGISVAYAGRTQFNNGTRNYFSGTWIGTSITLGVRPTGSVTALQALPALVGSSRRLVPSNNLGVGNDTSTGMLARFNGVLSTYPTMVSIEACYNDSGFGISVNTCTANITAMVAQARAVGARVTIWVPTYSCEEPLNTDLAPYRTAIRGLIVSLATDGFDPYNDFVALSGPTQTSYFLPGDCQHFSAAGLAWMAGLVGSGAYANSFIAATP